MPNVVAVVAREKGAIVRFDDKSEAWTPDYAKAAELIGKPIPEDWTHKQGNYGPQVFPPRPKGSAQQTAYRNTKEGQAYEQERMDRRTALMQAVAVAQADAGFAWLEVADSMYQWLRKTSSGVDVPVRPEVKSEGEPKPSGYGEGPSDKATPPATNLWDEARDLGLTPPKAVVMARKAGWDDVRSSTDLSDDQLRELIETRRKEVW